MPVAKPALGKARLARGGGSEGKVTAAAASRTSSWPIVGLLVLAALPLAFGIVRMLQFAGIVDVMPHVAGTFWTAAPSMLHILAAAVYAILGAFQFSDALRRSWPKWHRLSGKIVLLAGALVALSALWLTAHHASAMPAGLLLAGFRVVFAIGLMASLLLGFAAIIRRDIRRHREWMMRAYALALGSATQMIVLMLAEAITGETPGDFGRSGLMGLAWGVNLTFVEWWVRRDVSSTRGGGRSAEAGDIRLDGIGQSGTRPTEGRP